MGDVAVITPEQQAAFTMYSVPGQNTDGPMTQKAVTDALVASTISYDNSQNWYTEDNVQRVIDELRDDDYNLLNALGMTTVANVISINAPKNTVTNYTYNIRKGDRFRVKTVYGSGVAYANVSTRVNGVVEERIIQNQSTGQDVVFEVLHDADDFSIYSSGGATTVTIYPLVKNINPSYIDVFSPTFIEGSLYNGTYNVPASSTAYYKKRIIAVAKAGKRMKVTTQEGYYCSIHEYSTDYSSPIDLTNSTWLGYTHEWFTGELEFTPLDVTKTIALVCGKGANKDQVIDPSEGVNYKVETAYAVNQILPEIYQKANNAEIQLLGIQEGQKTIPVTFSLGVWNSNTGEWGTIRTRIASPQIPVDGSTLKFKMDVGFKYSLTLYDENKNILSSITDLWNESDGQYHELKGLHGFLTFNIAYNDNRTITTIPDFGFELISMGDHTSIGRETDFKTKYNGSRFFYTGAPITLQKRNYWLRYIWGYPSINSFVQQGMAIYGDVAILGSSTQSGTNVKAEAFKISNFSKLASMLLPRGGYSDIHSNVLCFGKTIGSGTLPYLYVSQWDGQHGCFVYDIASNYAATLQQVILPTNVSSDLIGAGNIDWIVDTDNNRLISIGYVDNTDVLTSLNGMQVCIFALPALTESVVNLTDADVLDSFHIDEFYVRQDCCYNNGNIYMMCGASNTLDYTKIAVINLAGRNVASVIDLKWLPQEPEGIDVYDNSLFIRVINNQQMYRLYFD
jgi:hypothetical protein